MNVTYKPQTIRETKERMLAMPDHWQVPFMDFVDDFRRSKDLSLLVDSFVADNEHWDALLASTVEYLCMEQGVDVPEWVRNVPTCKNPWFVSGMDSLRAITLVESPAPFRARKIFVLENFLNRV